MSTMSFSDDLSRVARVIEPMAAFVALVQHATGLGGATAESIVATITAGLRVLEDASDRASTPAEVKAQLAAITAKFAAAVDADRAEEDARLDAKFPEQTP